MFEGDLFFENLTKVKARITLACQRSGREDAEIALVAATKNVPLETIRLAYLAGLRIFAENRVQEAWPKIQAGPKDIKWHLIGHLQKNKINKALELNFDLIESLDSLDLALALNSKLANLKKTQKVLLEINIAQEQQKHGFVPENLSVVLPRLAQCQNIQILGIMTMGPNLENPELMRPYFKKTKKIFDNLKSEILNLKFLSMGMSKDFEVAIEEGATMVRLGRVLFGS